MNFRRGRQIVVHDSRLTYHGRPLVPPVALRRWTVHPHNTADYILTHVAHRATEVGGFDAVHFMAHGNSGYLQIGLDGFQITNADLFRHLRGKTRFIVFFGCMVGAEHQAGSWHRGHPTVYGQRVRAASEANVVVAQRLQEYTHRDGVIEFGDFEGPVDVFSGVGTIRTFQDDNPFRQEPRLNLEELIF